MVLDETSAGRLADVIDLAALGACPLCLLELAIEFREGRKPSRQLLAQTADWVWLEISDSLHAAVVRARMREAPHAEDALNDLKNHEWRSRLVQVVVERLAQDLAAEMS
ncbi:MAG: hypothetical protein E6G45_06325 [Actinobacteria bacterium]|nr:MAG: hypothetical protein E6G45_06325 [Actinomycetota bacterium]